MSKLQKSLEDIYKSALSNYYSGNNVDVFFNNIYVDECTMIGYRSVVNSAPAYAYNSDKFNSITQGTFRVEGKFAVNFKSTGYVEHIIQKGEAAKNSNTYQTLGRVSPIETGAGIKTSSKGGILNMYGKDYLNAALVNPRITALSDGELEQVRAKLRDYVWGHIKAGDEAEIESLREAMVGKYFDILVLIGNPNTENYDVKNVVDAQIIDVSLEVVKEQPLQLVYTFIARDVDRPSSAPDPFGFVQGNIPGISSLTISPNDFLEYLVALVEMYTGTNVVDQHILARINFEEGEVTNTNIQRSIFKVDYDHINRTSLNSILTLNHGKVRKEFTDVPSDFWWTATDVTTIVDQLHSPLSNLGVSFGPNMLKSAFPIGVQFTEVAFAGLSLTSPSESDIIAKVQHSTEDVAVDGPGKIVEDAIKQAVISGAIKFGERFFDDMRTKIEDAGRTDLLGVIDYIQNYNLITGAEELFKIDQSNPFIATVEQCQEHDPTNAILNNSPYHPLSADAPGETEYMRLDISQQEDIELENVCDTEKWLKDEEISIVNNISEYTELYNTPNTEKEVVDQTTTIELDPKYTRVYYEKDGSTDESVLLIKTRLGILNKLNPIIRSQLGSDSQLSPFIKTSGTANYGALADGGVSPFRSDNGGIFSYGREALTTYAADTLITSGNFDALSPWFFPGTAIDVNSFYQEAFAYTGKILVQYTMTILEEDTAGGIYSYTRGNLGPIRLESGTYYDIVDAGSVDQRFGFHAVVEGAYEWEYDGSGKKAQHMYNAGTEAAPDYKAWVTIDDVYVTQLDYTADVTAPLSTFPDEGCISFFVQPVGTSEATCLISATPSTIADDNSDTQCLYLGLDSTEKLQLGFYKVDNVDGNGNPLGDPVFALKTGATSMSTSNIYFVNLTWNKNGLEAGSDAFRVYLAQWNPATGECYPSEEAGCSISTSQATNFFANASKAYGLTVGKFMHPLHTVFAQSGGYIDNIKVRNVSDFDTVNYTDVRYEGVNANDICETDRNIIRKFKQNTYSYNIRSIYETKSISIGTPLDGETIIDNTIGDAHVNLIHTMFSDQDMYIAVYVPPTVTDIFTVNTATGSIVDKMETMSTVFTKPWTDMANANAWDKKNPTIKIVVNEYNNIADNITLGFPEGSVPVMPTQYVNISDTSKLITYTGQGAADQVGDTVVNNMNDGYDPSSAQLRTLVFTAIQRPNKRCIPVIIDGKSIILVPTIDTEKKLIEGIPIRHTYNMGTFAHLIINTKPATELVPSTDFAQMIGTYIRNESYAYIAIESAFYMDPAASWLVTPTVLNKELVIQDPDLNTFQPTIVAANEADLDMFTSTIGWWINIGAWFTDAVVPSSIAAVDSTVPTNNSFTLSTYPHKFTKWYSRLADQDSLDGTIFNYYANMENGYVESKPGFIPLMLTNFTDDIYTNWYNEDVNGTRRINANMHMGDVEITIDSTLLKSDDDSTFVEVGIVNDVAITGAGEEKFSLLLLNSQSPYNATAKQHQKAMRSHIYIQKDSTDLDNNATHTMYCSQYFKPVTGITVGLLQEVYVAGVEDTNRLTTYGDNCLLHLDLSQDDLDEYDNRYDFDAKIKLNGKTNTGFYDAIVKNGITTKDPAKSYLVDIHEFYNIYNSHMKGLYNDKALWRVIMNSALFDTGDSDNTIASLFADGNTLAADTVYRGIRLNIDQMPTLTGFLYQDDRALMKDTITFQYTGCAIHQDAATPIFDCNIFRFIPTDTEDIEGTNTELAAILNEDLSERYPELETTIYKDELSWPSFIYGAIPEQHRVYTPITFICRDQDNTYNSFTPYIICAHNSDTKFEILDRPTSLFFGLTTNERKVLSEGGANSTFLFVNDYRPEGESEWEDATSIVKHLSAVTMYDLYYYFTYDIDVNFIFNQMVSRFGNEVASLNSTEKQIKQAIAQVILQEIQDRMNETQPFNEDESKYKVRASTFFGLRDPIVDRSTRGRAREIAKGAEGQRFIRQHLMNAKERVDSDPVTPQTYMGARGKLRAYITAKDEWNVSMDPFTPGDTNHHVRFIVKRKPLTGTTD